MDELISVIVPIYNVAPYLEKCINSILNQTYRKLEIILVDDGSTDESGKICDKFAREDNRIIVVHQQNGKITRARKAGLKVATGKFVTFVDGDDWIEVNMYERLLSLADSETDIVMSGMYRDNDEGTYIKWKASKIFGEGIYENEKLIELKERMLSDLNGSLCNKLISRDIICEEMPFVDDDLYGLEDDIVTHMCVLVSRKVFITNEAYYHGYDRSDSATHTRHEDYYLMMHRALSCYKRMMSHGDDELKRDIRKTYAKRIMSGFGEVFEGTIIPQYYFPDSMNAPRNANIILYGAGNVGESYYQQIKNNDMFSIVLWVDKRIKKSKCLNKDIFSPDDILEQVYDYVLIAVLEKNVALEIRNDLGRLGVEKEKIIWEKPKSVVEMLGL